MTGLLAGLLIGVGQMAGLILLGYLFRVDRPNKEPKR